MEQLLVSLILLLSSISGVLSAVFCTFYDSHHVHYTAYCDNGCCTDACCNKDKDGVNDEGKDVEIVAVVMGGSVAITLVIAVACVICRFKKKKITSRLTYTSSPYPTTQQPSLPGGSQMPGYSNNQVNGGFYSNLADHRVPLAAPQGVANRPIIGPPGYIH